MNAEDDWEREQDLRRHEREEDLRDRWADDRERRLEQRQERRERRLEQSEFKHNDATAAAMVFRIQAEDVEAQAGAYFKKHIFEPLGIITGNAWVAGGCVREWVIRKKVGPGTDIDVWTTGPEEVARIKAAAKKAGWEELHSDERSDNYRSKLGKWVQVIKAFHFVDWVDTLERFDFTVCAFAVNHRGELFHHRDAFVDLAARRLAIIRLTFPVSSMVRAVKYVRKGFNICGGNLRRLVEAIQEEAGQEAINELANHAGRASRGEEEPDDDEDGGNIGSGRGWGRGLD